MKNQKGKKVYRDFFEHAAEQLSSSRIARANAKAQEEIKRIRLAHLREKLKLKQTEIKGFDQTQISKIENRPDMKLSTLVRYVVEGLGAEIEIKARLKGEDGEEITLFRELPGRRQGGGRSK